MCAGPAPDDGLRDADHAGATRLVELLLEADHPELAECCEPCYRRYIELIRDDAKYLAHEFHEFGEIGEETHRRLIKAWNEIAGLQDAAGGSTGRTVRREDAPVATAPTNKTNDNGVAPASADHRPESKTSPQYCWRRRGEMWEIRFDQECGTFPNLKGFGIIAKLLRFPNPSRVQPELISPVRTANS